MKFRKQMSRRTRESLHDLCGQLGPDDCIDPNEFFKPSRRRQKVDKKAQQLCRQVAQALDLTLSDCDDDRLLLLFVVDVVPAPDCSRLMVNVGADMALADFDHQDLIGRLESQTARLRSEIARAICRKRVPNLVFNLVPPTTQEDPEVKNEES